jgi:hypothetical protein
VHLDQLEGAPILILREREGLVQYSPLTDPDASVFSHSGGGHGNRVWTRRDADVAIAWYPGDGR